MPSFCVFVGPYAECLVPEAQDPGLPLGPGGNEWLPALPRCNVGGSRTPIVEHDGRRFVQYCFWSGGSGDGTAFEASADGGGYGAHDLSGVRPADEVAWFKREYAAELAQMDRHFRVQPVVRWGVIVSDT